MGVARYFDESKWDGESFPFGGVPLRDIPDEEWDTFPKHVQDSADALEFYRKTNPSPAHRSRTHTTPTPEASTEGDSQ